MLLMSLITGCWPRRAVTLGRVGSSSTRAMKIDPFVLLQGTALSANAAGACSITANEVLIRPLTPIPNYGPAECLTTYPQYVLTSLLKY
jgi:hypothetical protein